MTQTSFDESAEANRLNWSRLISAPDLWRARAAGAGALLAAAAAASLVGLLSNADTLRQSVKVALWIASAGFVVSVGCMLLASTWPSPRGNPRAQPTATNIYNYLRREVTPIRWLAMAGTYFGIAAVVSTAAAAILSTAPEPAPEGIISIHDPDSRSLLTLQCEHLPEYFFGVIDDGSGTMIEVTPTSDYCGGRAVTIDIPRAHTSFLTGDLQR